MEAALRHLERHGKQIQPELLQHLSPLGWQHINLTGDYLWTDASITAGTLRPLRQKIGVSDAKTLSVYLCPFYVTPPIWVI